MTTFIKRSYNGELMKSDVHQQFTSWKRFNLGTSTTNSESKSYKLCNFVEILFILVPKHNHIYKYWHAVYNIIWVVIYGHQNLVNWNVVAAGMIMMALKIMLIVFKRSTLQVHCWTSRLSSGYQEIIKWLSRAAHSKEHIVALDKTASNVANIMTTLESETETHFVSQNATTAYSLHLSK